MFKLVKSKSNDAQDVFFAKNSSKCSKKILGFNKSSSVDEAYKHLRTFLINSSKHEYCPIFAIASPKAKEGNSLTSANLAISFAQLGKKVLLIDADMREPKIDKLFGLVAERGLSDMLYIFGGSVPKNFHPAVEKGLQEMMSEGIQAGYKI